MKKEESIKNKLKVLSLTANDIANAQKRFYSVFSGAAVTAQELSRALNTLKPTK